MDLKVLVLSGGASSSAIYGGARPFNDLKTKRRVLKSVLNRTGSQWREAKTGVIWSRLRVPVSNLAAAFCTNWRREREAFVIPEYSELQ